MSETVEKNQKGVNILNIDQEKHIVTSVIGNLTGCEYRRTLLDFVQVSHI